MTAQKSSDSAKQYQTQKIKIFFLELALTFAFLIFFQFSSLSRATASYVSQYTASQPLVILGYMIIFGIAHYLFLLPTKFYKGYVLEHGFKLSNQRLPGWIKDEIKSTMISSIVFIILIELFYAFVRLAQYTWWIWMAIIWLIFSIVFARIFPTLILPLFYKYRDIGNANLKKALVELAEKNGVKILDVFQIDFSAKTKKANAALVGLGKSKRIILGDTLLSGYTEDQIKVVLAHELGHYKYLHMWKLILFGTVSTLASFYLIFILSGYILKLLAIPYIYDVSAFPMISLIFAVFGFIQMPLRNGYSRFLEREADGFAIEETANRDSFISCMEKLASQNLADRDPSRLVELLFYDHPPISKRVEFARGYKK